MLIYVDFIDDLYSVIVEGRGVVHRVPMLLFSLAVGTGIDYMCVISAISIYGQRYQCDLWVDGLISAYLILVNVAVLGTRILCMALAAKQNTVM